METGMQKQATSPFWQQDPVPSVPSCRDGNWLQPRSWIAGAVSPLGSWSLSLTPVKRTLQRAAGHVPRLVTVQGQARPPPGHLFWQSWVFPPQGPAGQRCSAARLLKRGWVEGAEWATAPLAPCFPQLGWSRCWAWLSTRWAHPGEGCSGAWWMGTTLWKHRTSFKHLVQLSKHLRVFQTISLLGRDQGSHHATVYTGEPCPAVPSSPVTWGNRPHLSGPQFPLL